MSYFTPGGGISSTTTVDTGAVNPLVVNIALTANVEASYALPANTRQYLGKLRSGTSKMQIGFTSGGTGTTYWTVGKGNFFADSGLLVTGLSLYFQTPDSGQVLELLIWT
jgi:hypothetical protein